VTGKTNRLSAWACGCSCAESRAGQEAFESLLRSASSLFLEGQRLLCCLSGDLAFKSRKRSH